MGFTEVQAKGLLRMKLSSLLQLEQQQQQQQLEETRRKAERLRRLLSDDAQLFTLIKEELQEIDRKYGGPRKTLFLRKGPQVSTKSPVVAMQRLNPGEGDGLETFDGEEEIIESQKDSKRSANCLKKRWPYFS